jgi:hypothetical protein
VRVRKIELRILGLALAGMWVAAFALIFIAYRPGGPVDLLVGLAAGGPAVVALLAVVRPPVARGDRAFAIIVWLALGAMLLLVPSIGSVIAQLQGRGPQTLMPSIEAAYPWLLALGATGLYAGLGLSGHHLGDRAARRRRLIEGIVLAVVLVAVTGTAFATAAVVNELALAGRPATSSRFGPTDPNVEPPLCDGYLAAGATATLDLHMDVSVDGDTTGLVTITGMRNGSDVRWSGFAATRAVLGQRGFWRVGGNAWELVQGFPRRAVGTSEIAGQDLDLALVAVALTPAGRAVPEDDGLAFVEGARARHCRIAIDGAILRRALPEIDLLIGQADVTRWRGQLDYWVFADGQLGQANGYAGGPALELDPDGLQAAVRFRLTAIDRGAPVTINAPE